MRGLWFRSLHAKHPTAAKLVLLMVAGVVALGAAEFAVRLSGRAPGVKLLFSTGECAYQRSDNPTLGFELKPNYRNSSADLKQTYESTNSYGQRDVEWPRDKPAQVRRVAMLGDSVVEGYGISASETMSRQLQLLYPQGTTEILNFGVSAYCTRAEVELLERKALAFHPDVVVLVFVDNDFNNFNREAFLLDRPTSRPSWAHFLFQRSHLFRLAAIHLNLFQYGVDANPERWNHQAIGDNNVVDGLARFTELARQHHFLPMIAIWPTFTDEQIRDAPAMPGDNEKLIVERLAAMHGIPSIRLSRSFKDDLAKNHATNPRFRYTIRDGMHPSLEGNRVAAAALWQALANFDESASARATILSSLTVDRADPAAVSAAKQASSNRGGDVVVLCNIAEDLSAQGKTDEAIKFLRLAIAEDPTYVLAQNKLGFLLQGQGNLVEAKLCLNKAIELDSACYLAHYNLGNIARLEKHYDESKRHFERAIAIAPECAELYNAYGFLLELQGIDAGAKEQFERAIELKPRLAIAHTNLGNLLLKQKRLDAARMEYERVLQIEPDNSMAHRNIGAVLESQGDLTRAADCYERALALDAHNEIAQRDLSRVREAAVKHR